MNLKEITSDLLNLFLNGSVSSQEIQSIVQKHTHLTCNQCGCPFLPEHPKTLDVKLSWGYESTGKDGDYDQWKLCSSCTEQFQKSYPLVCCKCRQSVPEAMADLHSRNPASIFYGDYSSCLERYQAKDSLHCGFEYAVINERILCEICYEDLIQSFKVKIGNHNSLFAGTTGQHLENRVEQGLKFQSYVQDSICGHYTAVPTFEEAKRLQDSRKIGRLSNPAVMRLYWADNENYLTICLTDDRSLKVELPLLKKLQDLDGPSPDFTKPQVLEAGQVLGFGDYRIQVSRLLQEDLELIT